LQLGVLSNCWKLRKGAAKLKRLRNTDQRAKSFQYSQTWTNDRLPLKTPTCQQWMQICGPTRGRCTGGPRYMRSFYLRIRVYAIEKWPFFWNISSNLQWL